jgi:tetratricopeptide (TPR) repeat protein
MHHTIILSATLAALLAFAAPAQAGMVEDCEQGGDPELRINGCTEVIRSGEWQGRDLAAAYNNRGYAYDDLGQYSRAIEDYDQALHFDPNDAVAYQNRGVSHENLGEYEQAAADWVRAIRIDGTSRAEWWQNYMKDRGHLSGTVDGVLTPGLERDLLACATDPAC